jgi:hypothetical protein
MRCGRDPFGTGPKSSTCTSVAYSTYTVPPVGFNHSFPVSAARRTRLILSSPLPIAETYSNSGIQLGYQIDIHLEVPSEATHCRWLKGLAPSFSLTSIALRDSDPEQSSQNSRGTSPPRHGCTLIIWPPAELQKCALHLSATLPLLPAFSVTVNLI